jgi:mono/diheme cytochrome c family protein
MVERSKKLEVWNSMHRKTLILILLAFAMVGLVACGGGEEPAADEGDSAIGDVSRGEELFKQQTIGPNNSPGCITCHALEEGVELVGPPQNDVGARAAGRVAGMSAEEYLRQSIVEPNAHLVEGYEADVMYQNFGEELSEEQIDDLVAYMLTLR